MLQGLNVTVIYHFTEYCIWVIAEFFLPVDYNQNGVMYTAV